jgi:hypothetical protein
MKDLKLVSRCHSTRIDLESLPRYHRGFLAAVTFRERCSKNITGSLLEPPAIPGACAAPEISERFIDFSHS